LNGHGLVATGLVCGYDARVILKGVEFRLPPGDFVGVIGPNGAGKSTLFRALSRVVRPWRGSVTLDGTDIWSMTPRQVARKLAVVTQGASPAADFTVRDLVLLGRLPHLGRWQREGPADNAAVDHALRITGISALADRLVGELSGGERQLVTVAQALAQEPQYLLLDEPVAHLDLAHQLEVLDLVDRICREHGVAVCCILHDLNLAARYCRRMIMLRDGMVVASGPPEEVLTPRNIREAYGCEVLLGTNPLSGHPLVLPVRSAQARPSRSGLHVHVVAGGGSAGPLFGLLLREGHWVTTGVLNQGDGDWERARALGIPVLEAPPFSHIGESHRVQLERWMRQSDVVVLAAVPFGPGNLVNLQAVLEATRQGIPVIMMNGDSRERDWTGGPAGKLLAEVATVAERADSLEQLVQLLRSRTSAEGDASSRGGSHRTSR